MQRLSRILRSLGLILVLAACNMQIGKAPMPQQPYQPPAWARGAVVYQVYVPGFTPEGTFTAATQRLADVHDLGADVIMLMPIHPTGIKYAHGSPYSVRDYRAVDPALGTMDDFRQFVQAAHKLGIRVIMDLVANHTAWDNPLISEHPDWYTHDGTGAIVSPNTDWTDVADLNYDSAALRAYMLETSLYWVDQAGIDGYRADASIMVPDDFWTSWREALKAKHPDLLLLSESDPFELYKAGFEVAYDWKTLPAFTLALKMPSLASHLGDAIVSEQGPDNLPVWRLRYLENHDQERIAKAATTPEQRKLAAAFLLTLPGLPLMYAGQEIGALNRPSIDRTKIDWPAGDAALRESYTALIRMRKATPALMQGTFTVLKGLPKGVFACERSAAFSRVVAVFNFNETAADVTLPETKGGQDLQTGEKIPTGSFTLSGYGFKVIKTR